jgi:hypothetical protein
MVTAQETQLEVRAEFLEHFRKGLYCAGFEAKVDGPSRYLFFTDEHVEEMESAIFLT